MWHFAPLVIMSNEFSRLRTLAAIPTASWNCYSSPGTICFSLSFFSWLISLPLISSKLDAHWHNAIYKIFWHLCFMPLTRNPKLIRVLQLSKLLTKSIKNDNSNISTNITSLIKILLTKPVFLQTPPYFKTQERSHSW